MSDLEQAVSEDAGSAAAEESTQSPVGGSEGSAGTGGTTAATPRTYDDASVQKLIRERLEQQKRSYEKKLSEFQKQKAEYDEMNSRLGKGFDAFARGLGLIKDEPPKYVDEKTLEEREKKLRHEFEEQRLYERLKSSWKSVSAKHAKFAQIPGFKEAVLSRYESDPNVEFEDVAEQIATEWTKYFAVQEAQEAAEKVAAPKANVVKPGGGAGAPTAKGTKGSVSERIAAKLRGE